MNEIFDGSDLAMRLGLRWSHTIQFGEVESGQVISSPHDAHHQITLPLAWSGESLNMEMTELMVRASMGERIDPLLSTISFHPDTDTEDEQIVNQMYQLQLAQQWVEIWVTDEIASMLSPEEAKINLASALNMLSVLGDEYVGLIDPVILNLETAFCLASVTRLGLSEDPEIQPLQQLVMDNLDAESADIVTQLGDQLAEQIPYLPTISDEALAHYEHITQAMLQVIGADFSASIVEHEGRYVWKFD